MREGSPNRPYAIYPLSASPTVRPEVSPYSRIFCPQVIRFQYFTVRRGYPVSLNQRKQGFYEIQQKKIWGTPAAGTIPPVRVRHPGTGLAWRGLPSASGAHLGR